ncbi:hypothetical protein CFSAN002064_22110 [Salmonella enterica subsp. enterica serovar Heidelberg str. CFSAN002064]|nr:hypothetical protein CFSAN002064_22110 [Salmonella enterica subsp. enterica serovar Heidelberg str. CFSAN002064]
MSRLTFALLLADEFTGVQQCRPRRAMNRAVYATAAH